MSKTTELELLQPTQPSVVPMVDDPMDIVRHAIDSKAAVEVLERTMAIRRELNVEKAKREFDAALAAFQAACPVIVKRKAGPQNAYRYAPLDDIVEQTRTLIREHGFSYRVTSEITDGWVRAICTITHAGGHSEESEFKVPVDDRNKMMSNPQRYAGSLTFSKRYAFCNAFGILTGDEDTDGRMEKPKPAAPSRAKATEKTRAWMISQLTNMTQQALQFAIDKAWIMPHEGLECWPLEHVPTTAADMEALKEAIRKH